MPLDTGSDTFWNAFGSPSVVRVKSLNKVGQGSSLFLTARIADSSAALQPTNVVNSVVTLRKSLELSVFPTGV